MKCNIKDLCDDLITLGTTKITLDFFGIGSSVADYLKEKEVYVYNFSGGLR